MAHREQFEFVNSVKIRFPNNFFNSKVLEVGSLDINGTIRNLFTSCEYLGIDVAAGKGVDRVCQGQEFDGPDDYYDTVISCECFEHNPHWVETFNVMHRVCKPGGLIVISCATTGRPEHGTRRSEPMSSPLTIQIGWEDYYKNLEDVDFIRNFNLDSMFSHYEFSSNDKSHDLYFIGIVAK